MSDHTTSQQLDKKQLLALLRGIVQVIFYQKMTIKEVKQQIFNVNENEEDSNETTQEYNNWIELYSSILQHAAYKNLSTSQFTDYLQQQQQKNGMSISENDMNVLNHFWNTEQHKIHSQLISNSNFTSALSEKKGGLKWRIDQLTNPDDLSEMTETVAIVELNTTMDSKVVFEVDKSTLFTVVEQLQEIQERIHSLSM